MALLNSNPLVPRWKFCFWDPSKQGATTEFCLNQKTVYNPGPVAATRPPFKSYTLLWVDPARTGDTTRVLTVNARTQFIPPPPATYRLLADHYLPGGFYPAGSVITEGDGSIPFGWIPTLAVDPQGTQAILSFHAAGPQGMLSATAIAAEGQWGFWFRGATSAPTVRWERVGTSTFFRLIGTTLSLPAKDAS